MASISVNFADYNCTAFRLLQYYFLQYYFFLASQSEVGSEMLLQSCEDYGRYATIALSSDTIATQSNENITLTGSNIGELAL